MFLFAVTMTASQSGGFSYHDHLYLFFTKMSPKSVFSLVSFLNYFFTSFYPPPRVQNIHLTVAIHFLALNQWSTTQYVNYMGQVISQAFLTALKLPI